MIQSADRDIAPNDGDLAPYLAPTRYIDCDTPAVAAHARKAAAGAADEIEVARKLYYAVRDGIRYDPYLIDLSAAGFRASTCLERGFGFCIAKATVLAALCRASRIPARLGFADVRNHLCTKRLSELMGGGDLFIYHGYTELYLAGKWVKATPAFNLSLCQKFRVRPLEFDGRHDSVFHPYDAEGRKHMEYVRDRGHYADLPFETIRRAFTTHYPRMCAAAAEAGARGDFEAEAAAESDAAGG